MVMQMMAQLTQGQAQLNQAMTEAMNQQLQINRNVERSVEYKDRSELKGIPKPDKFTGASGTWDSWWYKFKTWVESCHKNAVKIVAQVESQCDKEITESGLEVDFDEGAELVSAQARQALISLTEGEALEIVKNTSRGSHFGLEAMRRLLCKYDPQNPQANSALLKKSKKRPMDDAEAKDEKKRQEIAKDEEKKKRKQHLEEHYERFRYKGKDDVKPEVKKIPRRPGEKEKEKEAKREEKERSEKEDDKSPSRAPIELKSISPSRAPQDSRADSAQASKGKGKFSTGAKRFLEKAVREAANFMERKVRKKKEKSPSPQAQGAFTRRRSSIRLQPRLPGKFGISGGYHCLGHR